MSLALDLNLTKLPLKDYFAKFSQETGLEYQDALQLYEFFFSGVQSLVDAIRGRLSEGQLSESQKLIHQLKGSAANLRIENLHQLAATLEASAKAHRVEEMAQLIEALQSAIDQMY